MADISDADLAAGSEDVVIDCEAGRQMGCATFCCRLVVRLDPDEVVYDADGLRKNCVDKVPETGLCERLDPQTHRCTDWENRPSVCRGFDCNADELLQVVVREGFTGLVQLVTSQTRVPREEWVRVPELGSACANEARKPRPQGRRPGAAGQSPSPRAGRRGGSSVCVDDSEGLGD